MADDLAIDDDLLAEIRSLRESAWSLEMLERQLQPAVGVIPFVGAGLSKPFGVPSWSEFLRLSFPRQPAR